MPDPNHSPMTEQQVSAAVDTALLAAVRNLGLPARPHDSCRDSCIETGFDHFHLHPIQTRAVGAEGTKVAVLIEVEAVVRDALGYGGVIRHQALGSALTLSAAIQESAQVVTLDLVPPLCRLFGAEYGPQAERMKLSSYTEGDAAATQWEGFLGPVQVFDEEKLREAVQVGTPCTLMYQTLINYLADKRLHWVKVFGVRHLSGETQFTVAIDNEIVPQGCVEAMHKFDWSPFPNPCSFRQFFVIRPIGTMPVEQDQLLAQALKEQNLDATPRQPGAAPKPSRRWFGLGKKH